MGQILKKMKKQFRDILLKTEEIEHSKFKYIINNHYDRLAEWASSRCQLININKKKIIKIRIFVIKYSQVLKLKKQLKIKR